MKKQSILKSPYFLIGILVIVALVIIFIPKKTPVADDDQPFVPVQLDVVDSLVAVETNPTAENYITLGLAYYYEANLEKAIEATQQAVLLNPNDKIAYNNLGSYYNELNEWDKAIEALNKALEIDPVFDRAVVNLGIATKGKITDY